MSKSNPDSAIFMNDSAENVERKINKAYCPEGEIEGFWIATLADPDGNYFQLMTPWEDK